MEKKAVHRLEPAEAISIPLKLPTLLPIQLETCLAKSMFPLAIGAACQATASGKPTDPRSAAAAARQPTAANHQQSDSSSHLALVDGCLCFRDGKSHLCSCFNDK